MTDALAINLEAPCWLWMGKIDRAGYGNVRIGRNYVYAHRYMWTVMRGPIPEGMELDHLCRVTACVNPQHLEVVTHQENVLRGIGPSAIAAQKTHCPQGHPYSGDNLWIKANGNRRCRICHRVDVIAWNRRNRDHVNALARQRHARRVSV